MVQSEHRRYMRVRDEHGGSLSRMLAIHFRFYVCARSTIPTALSSTRQRRVVIMREVRSP